MAFKTGLMGAVYLDGALIEYVTSLSLSIDRDVAEAAIMGQEYKIKRVGAYGGEFSGSALVNTTSKAVLDAALAASTTTKNISVYPDRTDMSDYWYASAQFSSWNASGEPGGLWSGDFGGVFEQLQVAGFS
jgi:predicted ribonuclease toxin of YeeF-YezG toxin-antitoxin module